MYTKESKNLKKIGIGVGQHIADLGAGAGYYTLAAAKLVGNQGKVYAIDVQKNLLERIDNQAKNNNLDNVISIWGDIEVKNGTHLRDDSIDSVLIINVLFQVEDVKSTLKEASRILKPGGKLMLIDWEETNDTLGPKNENLINKQKVTELAQQEKLIPKDSFVAGSHHFGLIFEKPNFKIDK